MLHVETPNKSVLFSGDFDTRDSQLTVGAKPVKSDVLFVEERMEDEIIHQNRENERSLNGWLK